MKMYEDTKDRRANSKSHNKDENHKWSLATGANPLPPPVAVAVPVVACPSGVQLDI